MGRRDVYRGSELLAAETSEPSPRDRQFFAPDHLGTPRLITDRNGTIIEIHHLFGFGEELAPPTAERKRFTGHERDWNDDGRSDDLDYMHARYCSPHLGRFLSVDPAGESAVAASPQSWNRYSYARNQPLKFVDPDGREEQPASTSILDELLNFLKPTSTNQNTVPSTVFMDGEFRRVGVSAGDIVFIAGVAVAVSTFHDIFRASTPDDNTSETIRRQQGGAEEANRQFDAAVDPGTVENKDDGVKVGKDRKTGRTLVLRTRSTDRGGSKATLEEQRVTEEGKTRSRKVRFDPPDEDPE